MGRLSKDKRDTFYRLAKEKGYRARSAFKLLQLDSEFDLFSNVSRAVDLCAAPGSWSQVLSDKLYPGLTGKERQEYVQPKIIAVDLQPMAPIDGVHCMRGDITSMATAETIIQHFSGERVQLVVSDGAPDVTGLHDIDEFLQSQLLLSAMLITTNVLEKGGTMVAKIFRGPNTDFLYGQLRLLFNKVFIAKPSSSRNSSMEAFVVCQDFKAGSYANLPLDLGGYIDLREKTGDDPHADLDTDVIPYLYCGDLSDWGKDRDADKSYPVDTYIAPVAPPIDPPFQNSAQALKQKKPWELPY